MNIDSIHRGIVLDHIKAGKAMAIYQALQLDRLDCSVAIIKNVKSAKMGKKDIIKVDDRIDIDTSILGYIDPAITINVIEDGRIVEKKNISLPETIVNVIFCKNPRCITSVEQEIDHIFRLVNPATGAYRCLYCEHGQGG